MSTKLPSAILTGIPMPPSVNALYRNIPGKGRAKTALYRQYEAQMFQWRVRNQDQILNARALTWTLSEEFVLHVVYAFKFQRVSVLTLKNLPKKNDTSNRVKAIEDCMAKILGIDDKWFWSFEAHKHVQPSPSHGETVDMKISVSPANLIFLPA